MSVSLEAINRSVAYIENNLSEKLTVSEVAAAVNYSMYHLHRVFSNIIGMTMHSYIQRRQLTQAAERLIYSQQPIVEIAQLSGFDSQPAFSTVFKKMYKIPPGQFRYNRDYYPLQLPYNFNGYTVDNCNYENIQLASNDDIKPWIELTRLAVDGFPCWQEAQHIRAVKACIYQQRAYLLKCRGNVIGSMIADSKTGGIEFLAVHPVYKRTNIDKLFFAYAQQQIIKDKPLSITTFRANDKADTGYRQALIDIGFKADELLVEFGYPTQRFILERAI